MEITYRCVNLDDRTEAGQTAATPELAKLGAGGLSRKIRIGLERTDWTDHFGKLKVHRTILMDAETVPGEWELGI